MVEAAHRDPEVLNSQGLAGHSLVQFWMRRRKDMIDEDGELYELEIDPDKFYIIGCDEKVTTKLSLYRKHFAGQKPKGVIDRVYQKHIPEMSPDISYYSEDEYPHRDFALSCGIRASFCFPFIKRGHIGRYVLEVVSTCNQDIGTLRKFCESFKEIHCYSSFRSIHFQEYAISELDHLLEVACQTFQLPLAQYWTADYKASNFVHQFSYRDYEYLAPWCQFRDACLHKCSRAGQGLLGYSCKSREAFFCRDIAALSITKDSFAHYARSCGSVACFTIYLWINYPPFAERVLEFFLPSQKMDNDHTQSLLNSIWAIMKKFLPNCKLASGEHLGEVLSVKVINSSTQTESESFEIGQHQSSVPHHEGSGYTRTLKLFENGPDQSSNSNSYEEAATGEMSKRIPNEASQFWRSEDYFEVKGNTVAAERVDEPVEETTIEEAPYATSNVDIRNAMTTASQPFRSQTLNKPCQQEETMILESEGHTSQRLPHISRPLFEYGIEQDEQVLKIKKSTPNNYSCEEIFTGATSKRTPDDVEQIISLDELEDKSPIKCIEPQSLTSQLRRSEKIFGNEGNSVMIDHSTMEMTMEELVKQREHTVAAEIVNKHVEKSPMRDEDVGYDMNIASQPFLSGTMISIPQQEFRKETMLSENSVGKFLSLEDNTTIHFVNETSTEAHTSKRERKAEEDISFESVSKHFGRPLDDTATSFGVSRSTFKRICRDLGIKRWQNRKRKMDGDIYSKRTRKLKDEEPSRGNLSYSGVTPVQDTVFAHTGQDLNKMTVKVTYNGINIRFKLPGLSGIAELENNVIERLHLERDSFSIKYQDDEGDWVLIACDKDVWECMEVSRSLKKTTIKLLLDQPIHHHAP